VSTPERFTALGFPFTVAAADATVRTELFRMWAACRVGAAPQRDDPTRFVVARRAGRWILEVDGEERFTSEQPGRVVGALVWEVNQAAVAAAGGAGLAVVHAAGVVVDDVAVVLPGPSGSGKSTLVARLVADGLDYLSDEAVAIDVASRRALPYPKPVTIETPAKAALQRFAPEGSVASLHEPEWNLAPSTLRRDVAAREAVVGLIVIATYSPGASCTTTQVTRAEGLAALAQQAFHLRTDGARVFRDLERVAHGCRCHRVEYGDVDRASAAIRSLAEMEVRRG
jgi:hypothetical protein